MHINKYGDPCISILLTGDVILLPPISGKSAHAGKTSENSDNISILVEDKTNIYNEMSEARSQDSNEEDKEEVRLAQSDSEKEYVTLIDDFNKSCNLETNNGGM